MIKRLFSVIVILVVFLVFAMGNVPYLMVRPAEETTPSTKEEVAAEEEEADTAQKSALVDMVADVIEKRGKKDSTIYLIGNVIFHHNGAIIQCDSARKYSANAMDFFGHVLINKDSAYIYGDKASYDGKSNIAEVFAPIVKMMRGDASLYTQNLIFNTETNIGRFHDGGMIIHQDTNHMEAMDGEFNSNKNEVIFRNKVALRNPSYTAKSDSMMYNLDNGKITFLTHTIIWTKDQDILEASEGYVYTKQNLCQFTKDSYVLSTSNEIWAEKIEYNTTLKRATLLKDIQIIDTLHRVYGFGDEGLWDDSIKYALLTINPSIFSYSTDRTDTMYLKADSMVMTTCIDTTNLKRGEEYEKLSAPSETDDAADTTQVVSDTTEISDIVTDSIPALETDNVKKREKLSKQERKQNKEKKKDRKKNKIKDEPEVPDSVVITEPVAIQVDTIITDSVMPEIIMADSIKIDSIKTDSLLTDSLNLDHLQVDTIHIDSLMNDIRNLDSLSVLKDTLPQDTLSRLVRCYRHVRSWNLDYQFICDSLVVHTNDSTGSMIGKPVLWNEENQLIAEQIDAYTYDGKIDWANLTGDPIIVQKVLPIHPVKEDSMRFNQAAGTSMLTYFTDNELDSAILQGNVHNIYWMDHRGFTAGIADITCADLTIFFKERQLRRMRWNGNVDWKIYPLEKVDPEQPKFLEKFEWLDSIRPKGPEDIVTYKYLRPSQREEMLQLKKPTFGIEYKLLNKMKKGKEENIWEDRRDKTIVTPAYFLTR